MPLHSVDVPWSECIPKYVLEANMSTGTMHQVQDDRQQAAESSGASHVVSVVSTMNATKTMLIVTTSPSNHGITVRFWSGYISINAGEHAKYTSRLVCAIQGSNRDLLPSDHTEIIVIRGVNIPFTAAALPHCYIKRRPQWISLHPFPAPERLTTHLTPLQGVH